MSIYVCNSLQYPKTFQLSLTPAIEYNPIPGKPNSNQAYMILIRGRFIGPMQVITIGDNVVPNVPDAYNH